MSRRRCCCVDCVTLDLRPGGDWLDAWVDEPAGTSNIINAGQVASYDYSHPTGNWMVRFVINDAAITNTALGAYWTDGTTRVAIGTSLVNGDPTLIIDNYACNIVGVPAGAWEVRIFREITGETYSEYINSRVEIWDVATNTLLYWECHRIYPEDGVAGTALAIEIGGGVEEPIDMGDVKLYANGLDVAGCPRAQCDENVGCEARYLVTGGRIEVSGFQDSIGTGTQSHSNDQDCVPIQYTYSMTYPYSQLNGTYPAVPDDPRNGGTPLTAAEAQERIDEFLKGRICADDLHLRWTFPDEYQPFYFSVEGQGTNTASSRTGPPGKCNSSGGTSTTGALLERYEPMVPNLSSGRFGGFVPGTGTTEEVTPQINTAVTTAIRCSLPIEYTRTVPIGGAASGNDSYDNGLGNPGSAWEWSYTISTAGTGTLRYIWDVVAI